jgi:hypothetical protein
MLLARARTFALRDTFPDILLSLANSVEKLQVIPVDRPRIVDALPAPQPPKAEVPANAVMPPETSQPKTATKAPLLIRLHDGTNAEFERNGAGLEAALKFLNDGIIDRHPEVIDLNAKMLDWLVEKYPDMADDVAEMRAAAVMAAELTPDPDAESDGFVQNFVDPDGDDDTFPGDRPSAGS